MAEWSGLQPGSYISCVVECGLIDEGRECKLECN